MKTVTKFLTLALMLTALSAISVISANAQATEEVCKPIYQTFLDNRKGPEIEKYQTAIAAGKEFLQKCSTWEGQEEAIKYVTNQVPKVEANLAIAKKQKEIYEPYYAAIKAKDWAKVFSYGKMVANDTPDDVDTPLVLASMGFDLSVANPPVDTYNNDTISMAKLALQKMDQGKASASGLFGNITGYVYKTDACPDGKVNATGWMNYTIGNVMYNRLNQKKEALPYLYKATQVGCQTKDSIANIYRTIGNYYIDEFKRLEGEKNAAYDALVKIPSTTDPAFPDAKKKYDDLVALQKGYMERTMDAFARAYNAAVKGKETAAFSTAQLNRSKEFYKFRFGQDKVAGYDAWLKALPPAFPDPTSAVTPIVEAEPATTTAPTAMNASSDSTPTATTGTDTRPRTAPTTTATKPTATTTTTTTTTKPAATTKPAVTKKPAATKKP